MMPEEYVVSLVVEGDSSASLELRVDVEEWGEQTSHRLSQPSCEVVQNHFRPVAWDFSPVFLQYYKTLDIQLNVKKVLKING